MHSDQMRKDGISEPMIQALYYDFVANYVKTRMYYSVYTSCSSCTALISIIKALCSISNNTVQNWEHRVVIIQSFMISSKTVHHHTCIILALLLHS